VLRRRGEEDEALAVLEQVTGDFEAEGLAARIRLRRQAEPELAKALDALDEGSLEAGVEGLLAAVGAEDGRREEIRRAVVGALAGLEQGDPQAREYRRRLAAALY
jgi:putative thioredoxin